MRPTVSVVDYGLGNLFSVGRALEECGAQVRLIASPAEVEQAERLVLPGVGAFADGMRGLEERSLVPALQKFAASGRPMLGICLGMQLLMSESEEFGNHRGLDILEGQVVAIPPVQANGARRKIPHIGWTEIIAPTHRLSWDGSVLEGLEFGTPLYFVHSFTAAPRDPRSRLADCDYEGSLISAAVQSGNVFGCQFHPERSGPRGLAVIRNFINLPPTR